VVAGASFHHAGSLIELAVLQRRKGDMEAARLNLGRALALDETSMPALNQLALVYLDTAHVDMAALVASQAIERGVPFAPLFNTAGLVQTKLGKPSLASQMFQRAVAIDPKLFEAHVNLGNLNLSFRGFVRAEEAFRKAVALRPNDYEAHLGLALALRGQIGSPVERAKVEAVRVELERCKTIDPKRPDAWFNDGILAQEFDVKLGTDPRPALEHAIATFGEFKSRATGKSEYADALKKADDRIVDAKATRDFFP
jgi:Tfp pilus assembly protein PilF